MGHDHNLGFKKISPHAGASRRFILQKKAPKWQALIGDGKFKLFDLF